MTQKRIAIAILVIAALVGGVRWFTIENRVTSRASLTTSAPSLRTFKRELLPFYNGSKWGYVDFTGREVIEPAYDGMDEFFDDVAAVTKNSKWGYLESSGRFQSYADFNNLSRFSNGWGRASKVQGLLTTILGHYEKFTFVDLHGNRISSAWYDDAGDFSEGLARVNEGAGGFRQRVGGRWGFIDTNGNEVIALQFSQAGDFYEGLARVQSKRIWGFIRRDGNFQISPRFDYAHDFSEGLAAVTTNGKYQYVDKDGVTQIAGPFDIAYEFSEGRAVVVDVLMGPMKYIDRQGSIIGEPFEFAHPFSDGLARVSKGPSGAKFGFIDIDGNWAIPPRFTDVTDFVSGCAWVSDSPGYFIDKTGKRLHSPAVGMQP